MTTIKPFRYIEELDAFVETDEFISLSKKLGLLEWHASVWIGRLFTLDQDYGEHWFDNWDERDALEEKAQGLGIESHLLMIVAPFRLTDDSDGPCHTPDVKKVFWTDVLKSLELSYELLFLKARTYNQLQKDYSHEGYIPDLEDRIEQIRRECMLGK